MTKGEHLCSSDGATLRQACELWELYQSAAKIAASDPMERNHVGAVCRYQNQYLACLKLLCLDPLGRMKAARSQKRATKSPEMKYFA